MAQSAFNSIVNFNSTESSQLEINDETVMDNSIKKCNKCDCNFQNDVDDYKYKWCFKCRQKKRMKNKRERTNKRRRLGFASLEERIAPELSLQSITTGSIQNDSNTSAAIIKDNAEEQDFKKFYNSTEFLNYLVSCSMIKGHHTKLIFQTVVSATEISRFPKGFDFISIGAKTISKSKDLNVVDNVSYEDESIMSDFIQLVQPTSIIESSTVMSLLNLVSSPLLSIASIYIEKKFGLIIVNQPDSNSFLIQNNKKILDQLIIKLQNFEMMRNYIKANEVNSSKLQDEITFIFNIYAINASLSNQAYKYFKNYKFSIVKDLPTMINEYLVVPKLSNLDEAFYLKKKINDQIFEKYIMKISALTNYQFSRKRRDISQNGNFVLSYYCRQDNHYKKAELTNNKNIFDCKSKLGVIYNSIEGNLKMTYSHNEHEKFPQDSSLNDNENIINDNPYHRSDDPEWKNFSAVLNFTHDAHQQTNETHGNSNVKI
ncbi:hypothetical protein PACTADRAFT_15086 [Pachysolen tannophilus NRRL Y-2460]|uniref:Uncharacterized protein n=1 Tax=Pachysolen tannophilus NRRL Y-2460 TaxID=669874 RepID=A0A1E4TXR6_PACTA|nr:hypothetical protein PACTADRAFT_15086 [Pachysolen tannophilus NRRL Y-2460]